MDCIRRFLLFVITIAVLCIPVPVQAGDAITVSIPVSCSAKGSSESFHYSLRAESGEGQSITVNELELKDGGEGSFVTEFYLPGTYTYQAVQDPGTRSDTVYSKETYTVQAFVTEAEDGKLYCELIAFQKGSSEKSDRLLFTNTVKETKPPTEKKATITPRQKNDTGVSRTQSKQSGDVKTGDTSKPFLYIGLAVCAILVIAAVLKRNTKNDQKGGR